MSSPNLRLRTDLRFTPQASHKKWRCVIEDPVQNRYFRLGRAEYLIASLLDGTRSLPEVAIELRTIPEGAAITDSLLQSVTRWLVANGLAHPIEDTNLDAKHRQKESTLFGPIGDPFSFRIPIVPGESLERFTKKLSWLYSIPIAILSVVAMFAAMIVFISHPKEFSDLSTKLFVPDSVFWWLGAWLFLKTIHEMAHALACVVNGGTLRNAGLAFFYLAPVPYIDTTDMWRLPHRSARIVCAAAGVFAELTVSSLAILIFFATDHSVVQYCCFTVATLGTFTTLAFNANPLTRFDGYYVASDCLDRPTLWNDGQVAAKQILSWMTFGITPRLNTSLIAFATYGFCCAVYRWLIMLGLAWGTWSAWQGAGLFMIAIASYLWFVAPAIKRWGKGPISIRSHFANWPLRRCILAGATYGTVTLAFVAIPSPFQPMAPGVCRYAEQIVVRAVAEGIVKSIQARDGEDVRAEQPLLELENSKLELSLAKMRVDLELAEERSRGQRAALKLPELQAEQGKIESLRKQVADLQTQVEGLTPLAPNRGRFVSRNFEHQVGRFIKSGDSIGMIVLPDRLEIQCSISQLDVPIYRSQIDQPVWIRSESGRKYKGILKEVKPRYEETLEQPSLAAKYGGPLAVRFSSREDSKEPLKAIKPRNQAVVEPDERACRELRPGEICTIELVSDRASIFGLISRTFWSRIESLFPNS